MFLVVLLAAVVCHHSGVVATTPWSDLSKGTKAKWARHTPANEKKKKKFKWVHSSNKVAKAKREKEWTRARMHRLGGSRKVLRQKGSTSRVKRGDARRKSASVEGSKSVSASRLWLSPGGPEDKGRRPDSRSSRRLTESLGSVLGGGDAVDKRGGNGRDGGLVPSDRIVGGQDANSTVFGWYSIPFIERCQERVVGADRVEWVCDSNRYYWGGCGGTLVAPNYVLTAAHCLGEDFVRAGAQRMYEIGAYCGVWNVGWNCHRPSDLVGVEDFVIHPLYEQGGKVVRYDFALVKLQRPSTVAPVPRLDDGSVSWQLRNGDWLRAAGFGKTAHQGEFSEGLQEVNVRHVSQDQCRRMFGRGDIDESMICARDEEKDACTGDSGGPLVSFGEDGSPILVGVVSWGVECAHSYYPGVYGRVSTVRRWIDDVIAGRSNPPTHAPTAAPTVVPSMSPYSLVPSTVAPSTVAPSTLAPSSLAPFSAVPFTSAPIISRNPSPLSLPGSTSTVVSEQSVSSHVEATTKRLCRKRTTDKKKAKFEDAKGEWRRCKWLLKKSKRIQKYCRKKKKTSARASCPRTCSCHP